MRVWRGDASGGEFGDYDVEVDEGMVVLDVIHRIQATQAPDLAVRWNCKAGKCGSCSAEINGKPRLMCMTRMNTFDRRRDDHRPADEDVPGDQGPRHRRLLELRRSKTIPAFKPKPKEADGTHRMYQEDVDRVQEFHKCIECFLCQDVCHVIRDHDENKPAFVGPRFLIRLAALEMHPLDDDDRIDLIEAASTASAICNITKCCTEVCPEHINITDNGIIPLKERVVTRSYDPVAWALRRMRGKPADLGAGEPEPPSA